MAFLFVLLVFLFRGNFTLKGSILMQYSHAHMYIGRVIVIIPPLHATRGVIPSWEDCDV